MVNTSIGLIGVAKQADKATPATKPTYVHGLTGGKTFKLDRTIAEAEITCGIRTGIDSYVESVIPGVDFETYGYADVVPLYVFAAMGNIVSAANSGSAGTAKYAHTITLGNTLPYLTFWGRIGNEYTQTSGCKIDTLEMSFEGNQPLDWGITCIGLDATMGLTSFPGTVDPSCFDGYFVPTGGEFLVDTASGTPIAAPVTKGSISLSNSLSADPLAGEIMPGDVEEGKLTTSGSVTIKPDDATQYRQAITGSATGTKPTGEMIYGSFKWTFKHSKNSNYTLEVTASRVPFTCEFPDVDPSGGAAEFQFDFANIGVASKSDSPITFKVTNDVASYA
jgi:hypothetical protein